MGFEREFAVSIFNQDIIGFCELQQSNVLNENNS